MRSRGLKALVFVGILVQGGCTAFDSPNPASPYYAYPPGWVMRLNQTLQIPPGSATVRLQFGRIVPSNGVQDAYPFCIVEVNTVSAQAQMLQPGRFEVTQVTRSVSDITAAASPWVNPDYMKVSSGGDGGSPSFLYFITTFRLRDAGQPDIRSMRCAWNQMAPGNQSLMRHLTLDEIR